MRSLMHRLLKSCPLKRMLLILAPVALMTLPLESRADVLGAAHAALSAKSVAERTSALAELDAAKAGDPRAAYASGAVQFFVALEGLGARLHRHGFESPRSVMLPLMRLPVPDNPNPEPLTYEGLRKILTDFRDAMAAAAATLAMVPEKADVSIEVDLGQLGIDLNEDGAIAADESIAAIMAATANTGSMPSGAGSAPVFRFDRADGYWLQGYANFLMAQADFWLAHDFRLAFDQSFQMLFPRAKLPMQDQLVPLNNANSSNMFEWRFADFVSFIHLVNWPVVEPQRRQAARSELLEMIRLSRANWKAIRVETDNDREWLPGPQQTGAHQLTGLEVTETEVQAWHAVLDMAEALLEGRKLLPHFRFPDKGVNMKRFFEEPQTFNLVLSITGPGVVPYLEKGRILSSEEWSAIQTRFGRPGFMTFALWFN